MLVPFYPVPNTVLHIQMQGVRRGIENIVDKRVVALKAAKRVRFGMYVSAVYPIQAENPLFQEIQTNESVTRCAPFHIGIRRHITDHVPCGMVVRRIFLAHFATAFA